MDKNENNQTYIGELLREMRKEQGQSLRQISLKTKINPKIIKALEDKELNTLPNKVYVLGFIRTYAKALGFDSESAVKMMEKELGISQQAMNLSLAAESNLEKNEQSSTSMLGVAIVSLLVVGFIALIFKNMRSSEQAVTESESTPQTKAVEESYYTASLNNETPLIIEEAKNLAQKEVDEQEKLKTETPASTDLKKDETAAEKEKEVAKEKSKEEPKEEVKLTEKEKEEKEEEKKEEDGSEKFKFAKFQGELFTYNTQTQVTEEILPEQFKNATTSGMQNVFINAIDGDSWITYKKDEDDIKQFVLRQGKKLLIKGKDIRIFLGNTGAIHIFYNNKLLNLNAKSGVKSLVFPPENAKKYSIPLFVHKNPGEVVTSEEYQANLSSDKKNP
jgi:cytoskeleton protein RodZ